MTTYLDHFNLIDQSVDVYIQTHDLDRKSIETIGEIDALKEQFYILAQSGKIELDDPAMTSIVKDINSLVKQLFTSDLN
jgi:hypothetical protein